MAINASSITTSNTLEQFRQEFNNLVTDVSGLETGTTTFSAVSATTSNITTMNVLEDGTIVFEGATDDGNETTLTVVDPTADRTITLPNETGTVITTGTTANTFITGQTSIASAGIDSGNDELLVSDADASVFKRITVDNLISSAGGLTSVAADTTPQLGGDLDINGQDIVSTSNGNIDILPNGSGKVIMDGNGSSGGVLISDGAIEIRSGTGSVSEIKFYCEVMTQIWQCCTQQTRLMKVVFPVHSIICALCQQQNGNSLWPHGRANAHSNWRTQFTSPFFSSAL